MPRRPGATPVRTRRVTPHGMLIYTLAALFLCYEMALQVSPSVMTHELMRDLNIGAAGLGLIAACYFYAYTAMQIPAGLLFDRFSARVLLTAAIVVCGVGALFFTLAGSIVLVAIGRFLMGIGSAFAFIGVLVVASRWFPIYYFAFLVGIAQLLAAVGALGGEAPLAMLVSHFGWRGTLRILVAAGLVLAVLVLLVVRDQPTDNSLLAQAHATLEEKIGVFKVLKFVLANGQTWAVGLYAFSAWAPVAVFAALWGVPFLMAKYTIDSTEAAWMCATIWIGLALTSPLLGWFSDKLGRRCILLKFCSLLGVLCAAAALYLPDVSKTLMMVLLFGIGIAAAGQILTFAIVRDNNQQAVMATATGFNNMAVVAGGALFQPLVGYLLQVHWQGVKIHGTPIYALSNWAWALLVVPVCFLLGLLLSQFWIKETFCYSQCAKPRDAADVT